MTPGLFPADQTCYLKALYIPSCFLFFSVKGMAFETQVVKDSLWVYDFYFAKSKKRLLKEDLLSHLEILSYKTSITAKQLAFSEGQQWWPPYFRYLTNIILATYHRVLSWRM